MSDNHLMKFWNTLRIFVWRHRLPMGTIAVFIFLLVGPPGIVHRVARKFTPIKQTRMENITEIIRPVRNSSGGYKKYLRLVVTDPNTNKVWYRDVYVKDWHDFGMFKSNEPFSRAIIWENECGVLKANLYLSVGHREVIEWITDDF